MSLNKRPSEPFWLVFHFDPALAGVSTATFREYLLTKDIKKLPVDIATKTCTLNGEPVAMVKCKPMSRKDYLAWASNPIALRSDVIRTNVIEVHNIDGLKIAQDSDSGEMCLAKDCIDNMDEAVAITILDAIVDAAKGADGKERPFTLPDGFMGDRSRSLQLPAVIAMLEKSVKKADDGEKLTSDSEATQQKTEV